MTMYRGGLIREIRPEVEKPTGKTTVGRPLVLYALLMAIAVACCIAGLVWLFTAGRLVGPVWIGPDIAAGVIAYGVKSITVWPPAIEWKLQAQQHKAQLGWLLGAAFLCGALYLSGNWPAPTFPGGKLLWWAWKFYPLASSTEADLVIIGLARDYVVPAMVFVWARVVLLIALPVALPYATRLIWYRFGVEMVYPSWPDGAIPRGVRWIDPLGLLDIRLPSEKEQAPPIIPSAAGDDGAL